MLDFGRSLDFATLESGLRELNPGISFDAHIRRPSEYRLVFKGQTSENFTGIYYSGRYICSVDRGVIPEREVWKTRQDLVSIPMQDAEKYEQSKVAYIEILPKDPFYNEALLKAEQKHDNYVLDNDGRLFRYEAFTIGRVPDVLVRMGWRSTFEKLIAAGIPNITRESLSVKFGVDLTMPEGNNGNRSEQFIHPASGSASPL